MLHHDPSDNTVTHFIAKPRQNGGFYITLYRFLEGYSAYGQTECHCTPELKARNSICNYCRNKKMGIRPQYKGPLGWKFHSQQPDSEVLKQLQPIEKLPEITGDDMGARIFNPNNIYAG